MVGPELLALGGNAILGGVMKWSAEKRAHTALMDEMRLLAEDKRVAAFEAARNADAHILLRISRMIATVVVFLCYAFIIVGPAFCDVTVVYFYHELNQGFWPWTVPFDQMHSFTVGGGNNPIIVTPENRMVLMAITGFLFGTSSQQK